MLNKIKYCKIVLTFLLMIIIKMENIKKNLHFRLFQKKKYMFLVMLKKIKFKIYYNLFCLNNKHILL